MTLAQKRDSFSNRVRGPPPVNVERLECSICHDLLWKPVACQSCETPFCSSCINRWLTDNPTKCPNRCETYTERKCPPYIAKLLAELQINCSYESTGCNEVISYEALEKHEVECVYQSQQCPGCRSEILKSDFNNHKNRCVLIQLTCQECKLVYKRGDADTKHTDNICLREQLRQLRDESKQNKCEIQQLNLQLYKLSILIPALRTACITFDDLPSAVEEDKTIPTNYRGLKWTEIAYRHNSFAGIKVPKSGYVTSFIPGGSPHIAYFGTAVSISVEMPKKTITLVSVTACAAWNDDLQLTITGHRNSTQVHAQTSTLLFGQPQLILLQWKNIDKIIFVPSGGKAHPGNGGSTGLHVILTDLTIGPAHLTNTGWNMRLFS